MFSATLLVLCLVSAESSEAPSEDPPPRADAVVESSAQENSSGAPVPVFHPLYGRRVTAQTRAWLPSGRSTASIADLWFVETINQGIPAGDASLLDPPFLAAHGRSWLQTRFLLNGTDVTDPARSGQPLIEVPYFSWSSMEHQSLWTSQPGWRWNLAWAPPEDKDLAFRSVVGTGTPTGGSTLNPFDILEDDPATDRGALRERRQAKGHAHAYGEQSLRLKGGAPGHGIGLRLIADTVQQRQRYPTLRTSADRRIHDHVGRTTVGVGAVKETPTGNPYEGWILWQHEHRDNAGAPWRFPLELTAAQNTQALVLGTRGEVGFGKEALIDWHATWGWRRDSWDPNGASPQVTDLEQVWGLTHRPFETRRLERYLTDVQTSIRPSKNAPVWFEARGFGVAIRERADFRGDRSAESFLRSGSDPSAYLTVWEPSSELARWYAGASMGAKAKKRWGGLEVQGEAGVDFVAMDRGSQATFLSLEAAAGAAVAYHQSNGALWYLMARRDPEAATSEMSEFLDPRRNNGAVYAWNDNGDLIPQAGEEGALVRRTGGAAHGLAPGARRPSQNLISVGWRSPLWGGFQMTPTGTVRCLSDPWTVRLDGPAENSYVRTGSERTDPFERIPGTEGAERYALGNAKRVACWVGSEVHTTVRKEHWFLSLGLSGYWSYGTGSFGMWPDRNDPGILDESSADPNGRIYSRGQLDNGRAFGLNLLTGVNPVDALIVAAVIRYRDGQPINRIEAVDLPQGPTPIMITQRGTPGLRLTYHLTLDIRLRYAITLAGVDFIAAFDTFNLMNSGTEIAEEPGPVGGRSALEMIPGRSVFLSLGAEI